MAAVLAKATVSMMSRVNFGMVQSQITLQATPASYKVLKFIALCQNGVPYQ